MKYMSGFYLILILKLKFEAVFCIISRRRQFHWKWKCLIKEKVLYNNLLDRFTKGRLFLNAVFWSNKDLLITELLAQSLDWNSAEEQFFSPIN